MSSAAVTQLILHCQKHLKTKLKPDRALHYLRRLHRIHIKVKDLVETGIGKTVNQLARGDEEEVAAYAEKLVAEWKAVVEAEKSAEESTNSSSAPSSPEQQKQHQQDGEEGDDGTDGNESDEAPSKPYNIKQEYQEPDQDEDDDDDDDEADGLIIHESYNDDDNKKKNHHQGSRSSSSDDEVEEGSSSSDEEGINLKLKLPESPSSKIKVKLEIETDHGDDEVQLGTPGIHDVETDKESGPNDDDDDDQGEDEEYTPTQPVRIKTENNIVDDEQPSREIKVEVDDESESEDDKAEYKPKLEILHHANNNYSQTNHNHNHHHGHGHSQKSHDNKSKKSKIKDEPKDKSSSSSASASSSSSKSLTETPSPDKKSHKDKDKDNKKTMIEPEPKIKVEKIDDNDKRDKDAKDKEKDKAKSSSSKSSSKSPDKKQDKSKIKKLVTIKSEIDSTSGLNFADVLGVLDTVSSSSSSGGSKSKSGAHKSNALTNSSSKSKSNTSSSSKSSGVIVDLGKVKKEKVDQETGIDNIEKYHDHHKSSKQRVSHFKSESATTESMSSSKSKSTSSSSSAASPLKTKSSLTATKHGIKDEPKDKPVKSSSSTSPSKTKDHNNKHHHKGHTHSGKGESSSTSADNKRKVVALSQIITPHYKPSPSSSIISSSSAIPSSRHSKKHSDGLEILESLDDGGDDNLDNFDDLKQQNHVSSSTTSMNYVPTRKNSSDALAKMMSSRNQRTKVYSGIKSGYVGQVPSLYDMCLRVISENLDDLGFTGGVNYDILKPALEKASVAQLQQIEHFNPYLIEDTGELWAFHCKHDFRGKPRQELETWRELYIRLVDEREQKLQSAMKKVVKNIIEKPAERKAKLAYVESHSGPKYNKTKAATIKNGMKTLKVREEKVGLGLKRSYDQISSSTSSTDKAELHKAAEKKEKNTNVNHHVMKIEEASVIISAGSKAGSAPGSRSRSYNANGDYEPSSGASAGGLSLGGPPNKKPKKAPLMQKTLKIIKSLHRR